MEQNPLIQDLLHPSEADLEPEIEDQAPEQEATAIENQLEEAQITPPLRLDYKLKTCQERADLVNRIVALTPQEKLTTRYLELLGDYIMGGITKEEKKEHLYMTDNRRITIDRRETSFEGLAEKFENGADGIYNLITNDKNIIFQHRQEITPEDIETIPGLRELRDCIEQTEAAGKVATGRKKYLLKKQLIEMRKDQYVLKSAFRPTISVMPSHGGVNKINLEERRWIDEAGNPQSDGLVTLFNPKHVSALLCNYYALKIETRGRFHDDFYYLLRDLDATMKKALKDHPAYFDIIKYKMDNKTNLEIQQMLLEKHNISHSLQYISQLWRNRIPKIIAEQAQDDFIVAEYELNHPDQMKECVRCGELKPAITRFYSPNKNTKDGWYCWCKKCRRTPKK